jgi:hypothetical protein
MKITYLPIDSLKLEEKKEVWKKKVLVSAKTCNIMFF